MSLGGSVCIFIEGGSRDNELPAKLSRDDLDQFGSAVAHHNPLRRLIDHPARETGQHILGHRVVQHQVVQVLSQFSEEGLRREIEIVEIRMINEPVAPIAAVLA